MLLGGLISDQVQKTKCGNSRFSIDIPVVGDLFGTKSGQKQRTEIIMFIKPQLIRNSMDARGVAEEFRSSLELMREDHPIITGKGPPIQGDDERTGNDRFGGRISARTWQSS